MECEINSIACPICIDLSHKNHPIISLKKFLTAELPKLYAKRPDHALLAKVSIHTYRESTNSARPTKMYGCDDSAVREDEEDGRPPAQ